MFSDSLAFIQSRHLIPAGTRAILSTLGGFATGHTAIGQTRTTQSLQDIRIVLLLGQTRLRNRRTCDCQLRCLLLSSLTRIVRHATHLVCLRRRLHHLLSRGTTIDTNRSIPFDHLGLLTRRTMRTRIQKLLLVLQVTSQPFTVGRHLCGRRKKKEMRFFALDLHISVIADLKDILKDHEVVEWSLSGHNWVFGRNPTTPEIIHQGTWQSPSIRQFDEFRKR
jgi:hypothetical protein